MTEPGAPSPTLLDLLDPNTSRPTLDTGLLDLNSLGRVLDPNLLESSFVKSGGVVVPEVGGQGFEVPGLVEPGTSQQDSYDELDT